MVKFGYRYPFWIMDVEVYMELEKEVDVIIH